MTMTVNNDAVKGIKAVLPKGLAGSWVRTVAWSAGHAGFLNGYPYRSLDVDVRWRRATRSGTYNPTWQKKFKTKRRMGSWVTGEWH